MMWDLTFVLLSVLLGNFIWVKRKLFRLSWQMPGPSLTFLLSHFGKLFSGIPRGTLLLQIIQETINISKTPFRCWIGTTLYVIVKEPDDIESVLKSQHCLNRGRIYDFIKCFTGTGLVTLESIYKTYVI